MSKIGYYVELIKSNNQKEKVCPLNIFFTQKEHEFAKLCIALPEFDLKLKFAIYEEIFKGKFVQSIREKDFTWYVFLAKSDDFIEINKTDELLFYHPFLHTTDKILLEDKEKIYNLNILKKTSKILNNNNILGAIYTEIINSKNNFLVDLSQQIQEKIINKYQDMQLLSKILLSLIMKLKHFGHVEYSFSKNAIKCILNYSTDINLVYRKIYTIRGEKFKFQKLEKFPDFSTELEAINFLKKKFFTNSQRQEFTLYIELNFQLFIGLHIQINDIIGRIIHIDHFIGEQQFTKIIIIHYYIKFNELTNIYIENFNLIDEQIEEKPLEINLSLNPNSNEIQLVFQNHYNKIKTSYYEICYTN